MVVTAQRVRHPQVFSSRDRTVMGSAFPTKERIGSSVERQTCACGRLGARSATTTALRGHKSTTTSWSRFVAATYTWAF